MEAYLRKLEKRLYFLDEKERKKVVDAYRKKIVDKFKSGKSINESLREVGSIDAIVKKVCNDKNLSYDYCVRNTSLDKDISNISNIIGDFIRDIMKVVKKNVSGFSLQSSLEVLVKVLCLIMVFFVLKIPCILIEYLGNVVCGVLFYPYNESFSFINNIIVSIIYVISCILVTLKIFGNSKLVEKKEVNNKKIDSIDKDYKWLDFIIRIIIYLLLLIPLGLLGVVDLICIVVSVYLVSLGINLMGVPILFVGLLGLIGILFLSIRDSLNHKHNSYIVPLIISVIVFIFGISTIFVNVSKFKFSNNLNKSEFKKVTETVELDVKSDKVKLFINNANYQVIVDDSLVDNHVVAEVSYYDDYIDIIYSNIDEEGISVITFNSKLDENVNYLKNIKFVIEDLKNGYIFKYANADKYQVKLYVNQNLKNKILE